MQKLNKHFIYIVLILFVSCDSERPSEKTKKDQPSETRIADEQNSIADTTVTNIQIDTNIVNSTVDAVTPTETNIPGDENALATVPTEIIEAPEITTMGTKPEVIEEIIITKASHSEWDILLQTHVASNGNVNYKAFKSDISKLEKYLNHLSKTVPTEDWSKNEKLAYWINLYNVATVKLIIDNYPLRSITEINGGKPWDLKYIISGDKTYSLNQIENDIIRPRFNDPRIHMAVNCAAVSCPKLMNRAFVPEKLNSQLNKQAKLFVKNETKNVLSTDTIKISKIFEWYKADFDNDGGIIVFITKFSELEINKNAVISYLEYEWKLNEK